MLSGISLANTTFALLENYQSNTQFLNDAAAKIVSGKQLLSPSDGSVDYFRSEQMNMENSEDSDIENGISAATSFSQVTENVGTSVFSQMQDLESMVNNYYDTSATASEKSSIASAFSSAITVLNGTIQGAQYNGQNIYSTNGGTPLQSVTLDSSDPTRTLDIQFANSDIVDVSNLQAINLATSTQANALAAVQTEEEKAGSYVAKASANTISLQSQYNILQTKMTQNTNFNDVINSVDDAEETTDYSNALITQQMTMAMVAQGNLGQQSVLALISSK